jgi:hypothetical protein
MMADMRLIDANALNLRDRVITDMGGLCFIEDIETAIEEVPTIDAVPVVRCKDCKRFVEDKEAHVTYCKLGCDMRDVGHEDFCSSGERRDDGNGT